MLGPIDIKHCRFVYTTTPTFLLKVLTPSSWLTALHLLRLLSVNPEKGGTIFLRKSASTYKPTQCHNLKGCHFQAMRLSLRAWDGFRTCTKNPDEWWSEKESHEQWSEKESHERETTEPEILRDVNEYDIVQSVFVTGLKAGRPMRSSSIPLSGENFRSSR